MVFIWTRRFDVIQHAAGGDVYADAPVAATALERSLRARTGDRAIMRKALTGASELDLPS